MFNQQVISKFVRGLLISFAVSLVAVFLFAFIIWKWAPSETLINAGMLAVYVLSSGIGGFYSGKKIRTKKFVWGILIGFCYIGLLLIASAMIAGPTEIIKVQTILMIIVCVLSGMLGGMIA